MKYSSEIGANDLINADLSDCVNMGLKLVSYL